ncbi:ABC-F family ATP-binding cassette domain-containing protein [Acidipila sp. EB88]|uniref:ABC-F family ATP-binding cassette domain-containing protein n=1 Tax=Acidipila sp. EB88 TaxID=2305226 RepID=UPI00268EAA9E
MNAQSITKRFGAQPLFRDISLTINDGDRLALIGPNGAGKSTFLKILSGEIEPDSGEVSTRKRARITYIAQESAFPAGATVRSVLEAALARAGVSEGEREGRVREAFGRAGFGSLDDEAAAFSGGWRKRLAIVEASVQQPDILLLDEPTNHLDLAGISWLEEMLRTASFASVVVSHDRYFLEGIANETAELSKAYPDGMLRFSGAYSTFLEKKAEYLDAEGRRQEALENRVKIETEWLRRGPKARTTKSKARIDNANELIGELTGMRQRSATSSAGIDFSSSDRKTKRLAIIDGITYGFEGKTLFNDLSFAVTAGMRVGVVGPNGSGKTTLLRLVNGELTPQSGKIERANALRVVYFEQNREIEGTQTLRRALAPDSDSVVYNGKVLHVASWAARFLFTGEQLNQPVERLSGGERARVLIARLMLEPADLLLLDEPTNDLDIPTLEILEEALLEYPGALMLVTHDRYMLDRVSNVVLGLDGAGSFGSFADYGQWEDWERANRSGKSAAANGAAGAAGNGAGAAAAGGGGSKKKKLSYMEQREWETIEARIEEAEALVADKEARLHDPVVATDAAKLHAAMEESAAAQEAVHALYERWGELGAKQA